MVLSNLKVTGCGKVPDEKVLSNSQNLVIFFPSKVRETSCGKVPGEKVLSNSRRLVVVRYQMGAEQYSEDLVHSTEQNKPSNIFLSMNFILECL